MIRILVAKAPEGRQAVEVQITVRGEADSGAAVLLARDLRDRLRMADEPWVLVDDQGKLLDNGDSFHALAARREQKGPLN